RCVARRGQRLRTKRRVGIDIVHAAFRARRFDFRDVALSVYTCDLLARRFGRFVVRQIPIEPRADEPVPNSIETLRTLRMMRPHVVLAARWMGDICSRHGDWLSTVGIRGWQRGEEVQYKCNAVQVVV